MKRNIILTSLLLIGICLKAQTNTDSLFTIWKDPAQHDTIRLNAIDKIARDGYLLTQPDSAFYFAQLQYDFAKIKNLKEHMAIALNTQGITYSIRGDYTKAMDCFHRSLKIAKELGNKLRIAHPLNNIGLIYQHQGNYPKALEYLQKSLMIYEESDHKKGISGSFINIGNIYKNQGYYTKALDYLQRSLKISEEMDYTHRIVQSLADIGAVYKNLGEYPKALEYLHRSLNIAEEIKHKQRIASSLNDIGIIYYNQGNEQKALDYYQRSLKFYEEIGDKQGIAKIINNIGGIYIKQGDYPKAIAQCKKGLEIAKEVGVLEEQKKSCKCLYDIYKTTGNSIKALKYLEQMLVLTDSLQTEETTRRLERMEFQKAMLRDSIAKAEEARLVQETHEQNMRAQEKIRNISFGIGVFFILLAGGLYSRWRYVKKSNAIIETERDRSEKLILNILPVEIAQELKEKGNADARNFDMVSILFTDFKNFTEYSANMSATELVNEINHCFKAFDGITEKYSIEKIKTIGDAYMAAGGLPEPTDESVKKTVLAAIEMQEFISVRKAEMDAQNKPAFEMRAGIHTGTVIAGIVGVKKFQYDIWGNTVNTASRMENSGEVGKVNISNATYELIKHEKQFLFESRGFIDIKGKGKMELWFVSLKT